MRLSMAALQPFSPASTRLQLSVRRLPSRRPGCGCFLKSAMSVSSFPNYLKIQDKTNVFLNKSLTTEHSNKRETIVRRATTEEIQAEKSVVEGTAKEKMEKAIITVLESFNTVRTGRANPAMLDRVEVEYYGSPVSLKSIAQISTPDGGTLLVQPYDKSCLKAIEKAIVKSNLGLTPTNDGEVIIASVPQLTSERRKELLKVVAKLAEDGKVAVRNIRRDALKAYDKLEKEKKLSKDNVKDLSVDIQKLTDDYIKKIDSLSKEKEKEVMTV